MSTTPNGIVNGTPLDTRELVEEFYVNQSGHFRTNPAIKNNWPAPGWALASNSIASVPIDISGRGVHTVQVTGINVSSGDTVQIQANLDNGTTYYALPMQPQVASPTVVTTITVDGLYVFVGNYWMVKAVVTAGSNTGTTNITIFSRP